MTEVWGDWHTCEGKLFIGDIAKVRHRDGLCPKCAKSAARKLEDAEREADQARRHAEAARAVG